LGVRRSASCRIAGVILGTDDVGVGLTRPSQGNSAPGGRVGFGDRASISSCVTLFATLDGVMIRSHVVSSLIIERSVGRVEWVEVPKDVRSIYLSATFALFTNMRRRVLPYLRRRVFRACRMRCRIILRSPSKHACKACEGGCPGRDGVLHG